MHYTILLTKYPKGEHDITISLDKTHSIAFFPKVREGKTTTHVQVFESYEDKWKKSLVLSFKGHTYQEVKDWCVANKEEILENSYFNSKNKYYK